MERMIFVLLCVCLFLLENKFHSGHVNGRIRTEEVAASCGSALRRGALFKQQPVILGKATADTSLSKNLYPCSGRRLGSGADLRSNSCVRAPNHNGKKLNLMTNLQKRLWCVSDGLLRIVFIWE